MNELKSLEQRISKLESGNISLFGRSYNQTGNLDSDFLVKTKGQVKILIGSKFIDLIKDGKINVNSNFIYKEDSVGVKDGIYVIGEDEVWIVIGDEKINLKGEAGNTYVSFLGLQETTSELKYNALVNIGFLYKDLQSLDERSLKNGIIYVESTQKLYIIKDGKLEEFSLKIKNPYPEQFVISKETNDKGAIVIKGFGINNSLAFSNLYIYSENISNYIESDVNLIIKSSLLNILSSVNIQGALKISTIESDSNSNTKGGFKLYKSSDGYSILEIDKVIEREQPSNQLFPEYWFLNNNVIKNITFIDSVITITFSQEHTYKVKDILVSYIKPDLLIIFEVKTIVDNNSIKVETTDFKEDFIKNLINQYVYLVKASNNDLPIRLKDNNIDIIEYQWENEKLVYLIKSRFGKLNDLKLTYLDNGKEEKVSGNGLFSNNAVFSKAKYTKDVNIPITDDSSNFASTNWVRNYNKENIIPKGIIVLYGGEEIPEGWSLCNGVDGTPNIADMVIGAAIYHYIIKI